LSQIYILSTPERAKISATMHPSPPTPATKAELDEIVS
jgi:hypothetical protein